MDSVGSGDALIRNQHVAQLSAKPILPLHHVPIEDDSASIPRPNNDGNRSLPAVRAKNCVVPPKCGCICIVQIGHGFAELGMAVAREWRGRGVGSALLAAAIEWAREHGLHKLCLGVFAHNAAAIALYRKFGFVEEGRRVKQYRRASGELWDTVDMGLLL